jgi:hypothetical protein
MKHLHCCIPKEDRGLIAQKTGKNSCFFFPSVVECCFWLSGVSVGGSCLLLLVDNQQQTTNTADVGWRVPSIDCRVSVFLLVPGCRVLVVDSRCRPPYFNFLLSVPSSNYRVILQPSNSQHKYAPFLR